MNYCRKCQSDYEKPGTCNCFAPPPETQPAFLPVNPPPTTAPTYQPIWVKTGVQACQFCGAFDCMKTHVYCGATTSIPGYGLVVSNFVDAANVKGPWSYTRSDDIDTTDLGPPLSYEDAVKIGRSMMGGDTSHMVDE